MKKDKSISKERVEHILHAIDLIHRFLESHHLASFLMDERTMSACLYQFAIIGEAVRHMDDDLLEKYAYPWYKIKAFRNFIIHEYHGIEMKVVWDTAATSLPGLKEVMERMLKEEFMT